MSKKVPSYIQYSKTFYRSDLKKFTIAPDNFNCNQYEKIFADSLLSSYSSLNDPKHKLPNGIFLDSVPSHIRKSQDEIDHSFFRTEALHTNADGSVFTQPYIKSVKDNNEYFNTIMAYSYNNYEILIKGTSKFLGLGGEFIVHRSPETDPLREDDLGCCNEITFQRIEIDKTQLTMALQSRVKKDIGKIKTILDKGSKIGEQYHYKIYLNDFPTFLFALKCSNDNPKIKSKKLFESYDTYLGEEFHNVSVDSTSVESLNIFLNDINQTSEVSIGGEHNE